MWRKINQSMYIIDEFENGEFISNLSFMLLSTLSTCLHPSKILTHTDLLVSN